MDWRRRTARRLCLATAATGLALTGQARAQLGASTAGNQPPPASPAQTTPASTVAPNTTPAANPSAPGKVEEIVVTTQKRRQNVQDVPASVTAISNASLDQNNITDFSRLPVLVPGLQFGQSGDDARPAIRGTRTQNVVGNSDPLVSFYVDDVYRSRPTQANSPIVDVDRVEVARGPQGTLSGGNSFGGTVNVLSKAPVLNLFDYGGEVSFTSYNGRKFEGYVNMPLSPDWSARISGYDSQRDGYVKNSGNPGGDLHDDDTEFARAQLRYQPSEDFNNVARFEYWHSGGNGGGDYGYYTPGVPVDPRTGQTNGVTGIIDPRIGNYITGVGNAKGDPNPYQISINFPQRRRIDQFDASDTLTARLGDLADLKVVVSGDDFKEFRLADADFTAAPLYWNSETEKDRTWTEEAQIASRPGSLPIPLSLVAGVFFLQDSADDLYLFGDDPQSPTLVAKHLNGYTTNPGIDPGLYIGGPFALTTHTYAAYSDANYAVLPWLKIIGGIRWTEDERYGQDFNPNGGLNQAGTAYASIPATTNQVTFAKFTWRAGFEANLAKRSMVYFTASTGFLSGNFDGTSALDIEKPQTVTAYELGTKNVFFGGRLRANASLYYNEYQELLSQKLIFEPGGAIVTQQANAGAVTAYGAEGELDYYPTDPLYVGVRLSLNHSRFDDFVTSNAYTEGSNAPNGTFQLNGLQVPLNPDYTLSFITSYTIDAGRWGVFTPAATVYASDSYRTSDQPYFFANQKSYVNLDLHLRWKPNQESPITAEVYADNATDNTVLLRTTPNTGGVIYQDFAPPLFVGGRIAYHY